MRLTCGVLLALCIAGFTAAQTGEKEAKSVAKSICIAPQAMFGAADARSGSRPLPTKLGKDQKYVVAWDEPLVVDWWSPDTGDISFKEFAGPRAYSAHNTITGQQPDADNDDIVTVKFKHIYEFRVKASGIVYAQVFPAIGKPGSDGKPAPLTRADIVRRTLDVDDGTGPRPPPDPGPNPTPTVAPIDIKGFSVLIIREKDQPISAAQSTIMTSAVVKDYLDAKCGLEGESKAWRILDKDVKFADLSSPWKKALARERGPLPWIIISNTVTGVHMECALPANTADTMTLLRKYGG
jgi:hypothetical protein